MEDQLERVIRQRPKVFQIIADEQRLEKDINFTRIRIQAMKRWAMKEFMTVKDESQSKKESDHNLTRISITKE